MNPDYLQLIPLLSLAAYLLYYTYYYAFPMFRLKLLLFYAHIRYRDIGVLFRSGKITVKLTRDGEARSLVRELDTDPTLRYFAMDVCSSFRRILRDIRRGCFAEEKTGQLDS